MGENSFIIWGILFSAFITSSSAGKSEIVVGLMRFFYRKDKNVHTIDVGIMLSLSSTNLSKQGLFRSLFIVKGALLLLKSLFVHSFRRFYRILCLSFSNLRSTTHFKCQYLSIVSIISSLEQRSL